MFGQTLKEFTRQRVDHLSEQLLGRELRPIEYNMFLFKHDDYLEKLYIRFKQDLDKTIVQYLNSLEEEK